MSEAAGTSYFIILAKKHDNIILYYKIVIYRIDFVIPRSYNPHIKQNHF